MTIKNGDLPAMPVCYDARMMAAYSKGEAMGLTKREQFAAMAMQGILSAGVNRLTLNYDQLASQAVFYADFLLKELERTK